MTYTKEYAFTETDRQTAALAKALAHPARIAILKYLAEVKKCISGDITKEIPLSRTTVSQHLQELKEAGLIQGETEGKNVCYCLHPEGVARLSQSLLSFIEPLNSYLNEYSANPSDNDCACNG